MNERIKLLRKELNLTTEAFGEKLGITRSAVSNIENGHRAVTPQMLKSICREFNVNEEWLRTGKGAMFIKLDRNSQIADWVGKCLTDESLETQRRLLKILSELPPEYWQSFADFGNRLVKEFSKKEED